MLRIDDELLERLGLSSLEAEVRQELCAFIYGTLESRVGQDLVSRLSDEQLETFEAFVDAEDAPAARAWLEQHAPNYEQIVQSHFKALTDEIASQAEHIIAFEQRLAAEQGATP